MTPNRPGTTTDDPYFDKVILNEICNRGCDRIDDIFQSLGVSVRRSGKRLIGRCPVHGGRSPFSLNFYPDGHEVRGNWQCLSRKCHKHFVRSLVGLVRGVLSHERHGWEQEGDERVSHRRAVDHILGVLGLDISEIRVERSRVEAAQLARDIEFLRKRPPITQEALCTPQQFRNMIRMPADYYLERGFCEETLERFGVGVVRKARSEHYGRVAIPVYDPAGEVILGAITRSVEPTCPECRLCHDPDSPCPPAAEALAHVRWRIVGNFVDKHHLYGLWHARETIASSRCVVLVEGAGDVWRLHEAGIRNAVGLFGSELNDLQEVALQLLGVRNLIILTDSDEAGDAAASQIKQQCGIFTNVSRLTVEAGKDIADLSADEIRAAYRPQIEAKMQRA